MKFILLILFATVLIFSCKNNSQSTFPNEYINKDLKYSLHFPANWKMDSLQYILQEDIANTSYVFQENIRIGVEKNPVKMPANAYAKMSNTMFALLDSTYKTIQVDSLSIHNILAYRSQFTSSKNNVSIKGILYTFVQDSMAYTLQCNAMDTSFASHQHVFESIANTFEINK